MQILKENILDAEMLIGNPNGDPDDAFMILGEPIRSMNKNGRFEFLEKIPYFLNSGTLTSSGSGSMASNPVEPEPECPIPPVCSRRSSKELSVTSTECKNLEKSKLARMP